MRTTTDLPGLIERHISEGGFAGAAVAVARGHETVFEHYAGQAAPGLPSSPAVLWPIASITKCFTAAMVMRLVELGELTVNTQVGTVIPSFSGDGRDEVTLRHLLTHTSGLPYESGAMEDRLRSHTPIEGMVEEACAAPLSFRPGTRFRYGDYNYLLAGRMGEVVTGASFSDLVHGLVIEPMGLADTFVTPGTAVDGRIACVRGVLAEGTDGAMYNSRYGRSLGHPAFGVVSSLRDMVRFGAHFAPGGPRVHAEPTIRAMTSPQTGDVPGEHPAPIGYGTDARIPWGYGFELQNEQVPAVLSELASSSSFGHGGASGCMLLIDPVAELVVVVHSNTHILTGPDPWLTRLQSILNAAIAAYGGR
jgi:CubicO group peptidase (beta-lactamase class C family)